MSDENQSNAAPEPTKRMTMPQDIRFSTESDDRTQLMEKYQNYQISETNLCHVRFVIDHRQKRAFCGLSEGEEYESLQNLGKTFDLNIFPGYQQPMRHSYKIFATEGNVRKCLLEIMNRIFTKRSTINSVHNEKDQSPSVAPDEEKSETKELQYTPIEKKPEFKFCLLITSQGQEVLKKHWSHFGGSLQQRLNVVVTNPTRLPKFGDKQVHFELSITGTSFDSLTDAVLQLTAFINEVLGVAPQPFKTTTSDEPTENESQQRKSTTTTTNNYSDRTFFNRNRSEVQERTILLRHDCVARIVGKRGANIKFIKNKNHLRDLTIERDEEGKEYRRCFLSAYQTRNIQMAIETIRSFLHNEDSTAVRLLEENSSSSSDPTDKETTFNMKSFQLTNNSQQSFPQSSYNFQNTPSFDFTHQATSAARKTDKRPGDLVENSPHLRTPSETDDHRHHQSSSSTSSSISPKHRTKRTCPETKEINCATDDGFWIQKQYYHALDEQSKDLFDSLMDKLEKIRIATEENAVKKQQRLAGRNRPMKSRVCPTTVATLNEENNRSESNLIIKPIVDEKEIQNEPDKDPSEEKENQQDIPSIVGQEN